MNCDFAIDGEWATCKRPACARKLPYRGGILAATCRVEGEGDECGQQAAKPTWAGMVLSYVKAQLKQFASGQTVDGEEITERHRTCLGCDKHKEGYCTLCGCATNGGGNVLTNKLALAQPDWPVITNAKGETIFECPQIQREKAKWGPETPLAKDYFQMNAYGVVIDADNVSKLG